MLSVSSQVQDPQNQIINGTVARPIGVHSSRSDGSIDTEVFSLFVRRSVKWFILGSILGIGAAYYAIQNFASDAYSFTGRLTLAHSAIGFPYFDRSDAIEYSAMIDAPDTIRELHQTVDLKQPQRATVASLTVEANERSRDLVVEYESDKPEQAEEVLGTLLDIVCRKTRDARNKVADEHLTQFAERKEALDKEQVRVQSEYDTLCEEYNTHDLESRIDAIMTEKVTTEIALDRQRLVHKLQQQNVALLRERIGKVRDGKFSPAELHVLKAEAEMQTDWQLHTMLKEELIDHRAKESARIKLIAKEQELARLQKLVERSLVTKSELELVQSEVEVLRLEAQGDSTSDGLRSSIGSITEKFDSKTHAEETAKAQILVKLEEELRTEIQELELAVGEVTNYEQHLDQIDAEHEKLIAVSPRIRKFKVELASVKEQLDKLAHETLAMSQLKETEGHALMISGDVTPSLDPVSSNKSKMAVLGFGAGSLLLLLPGLLIEFFRANPNPSERLATRHGLPILSRHSRKAGKKTIGGSTSRILASRIQRLQLAFGSSVSLVSTGQKPCPIGILFGAATHLRGAEGRVLIVELCDGNRTTPLPCEFSSEKIQDQELQVTSSSTGVDRLLISDSSLLCNAMSNETWDELAASIRSYRYILVGGLSAKDPTTATLVASGADAAIVCSLDRKATSVEATHLINDLIDFDTPLLGAVVAS